MNRNKGAALRASNAEEWIPVEHDGLGSRLVVVAEGSVLVRIQEQPAAIQNVLSRHSPAILFGLALLLACVSATALGTTYIIHRDAAERMKAQTSELQSTLDAAVVTARVRSDEQIGSLLLRTDDLGQKIEQISRHVDLASRDMLASVSGSLSSVRSALEGMAPPSALSFAAFGAPSASLRFEHGDRAASLREAQTFRTATGAGVRPLLRPKPRAVACRSRFDPSGDQPKQGFQAPCVDPVGLHDSPNHRVDEGAFDGEIADVVPHEPPPPRDHADGQH